MYATVMLGAAVYFGLTGADDILNTTTTWERSVGVAATLYGLVAGVALFGYWRRTGWLTGIALVWALLVTLTATLATLVYAPSIVGVLSSFIATGLITGTVFVACRSRWKDPSTN